MPNVIRLLNYLAQLKRAKARGDDAEIARLLPIIALTAGGRPVPRDHAKQALAANIRDERLAPRHP